MHLHREIEEHDSRTQDSQGESGSFWASIQWPSSKMQNHNTLACELLWGLVHLAILVLFGKEMPSYLYMDLSVSSLPSGHESGKTLKAVCVILGAILPMVSFPYFIS